MFRLELASPHPLHQALRKIEAFSLLTRALLGDFHGHGLPRGCSCTPTSGASTPACCSRVRDRLRASRAVSCHTQPGRTISNAHAAHTGENCSQQEPAPARVRLSSRGLAREMTRRLAHGHARRSGSPRAPRTLFPAAPAPLQVAALPLSAIGEAEAVSQRALRTTPTMDAPLRAAEAARAEGARAQEGLSCVSATSSHARSTRVTHPPTAPQLPSQAYHARVAETCGRGERQQREGKQRVHAPWVSQTLQDAVKKRLIHLSRRTTRALRPHARRQRRVRPTLGAEAAAPLAAAPATTRRSSVA